MACIQGYRMNVSSPFNVNVWLTQKHPHLNNALSGRVYSEKMNPEWFCSIFKEDSASATLGCAVFLVCLS